MSYAIKTGRAFYALALIVYGMQQFYFGTFRNVFFSPYQEHLPFRTLLAYAFGVFLVGAGVFVLAEKQGRKAALSVGAVFLVLFLGTHLPYELISEPNQISHLALWVNPLKELALAGGAFVVAGSFQCNTSENKLLKALEKLAPYGNLFFLFTMTCFGFCHLIYGTHLNHYVPAGWADPGFWVYFTGGALVGAGVAIMLGIRIRVVALLLAIMLFLWFWMVHVPAGIARPVFDRGNLVASAFDALAFSGIALLIAFTLKSQQWVADLDNWQ